MILKTKIAWLSAKELSEQEQAKKDYYGKDYKSDSDPYDRIKKDAIVDTDYSKLYIQLDEEQVVIQHLLGTVFLANDDGTHTRFEDSIIIYSNIDEIYEQLLQDRKENNLKTI